MQTSKRILFAALIVFCLAIFYFSCASIIHGTKQSITINSTPTQAVFEVKTEGGAIVFHGYTPATVSLDRKNAYDVTIYLDGYQPASLHISKNFDPIFLGNILLGGIIGMVVDYAKGAMYKLSPETINIMLITASKENGAAEIYVVCRLVDEKGQLKTIAMPLIKAH